jgi:DNA-binding GntR family transcriptional regulator
MNAKFEEIRVESVRDRVVAALKDAFFSGTLKPGDVIVERRLAQQMKVGTPTIREALITLQEQGFIRRVAKTATYVTKFTAEEVRKLQLLRVELELLAFQWAKPRVVPEDLQRLDELVARLEEAGQQGDKRKFLERDSEFHSYCWWLSGNEFLADLLRKLMSPLSAFVVLGSGVELTASMAHEHRALIEALRSLEEPEFSAVIRKTLTGFAIRWISVMSSAAAEPAPAVAESTVSG